MTAGGQPRVAAVVVYTPAMVAALLKDGAPRQDRLRWILCGPLPPEVMTSETWLVVRYPWSRVEADGRLARDLKGVVRAVQLGRLLADADIVAAADAAAAADVRRLGRLYRKPTLDPPFDPETVRVGLAPDPDR